MLLKPLLNLHTNQRSIDALGATARHAPPGVRCVASETTDPPMKPRKDVPAGAAREPQDCEEVERYRAPALDKGLDILELLAEQKEGLTRTEITKELGRNASEIYRMLERLVAR
ncbi:helix-turn-helix domain-containing protein, partial [Burkholderia thailandensis]|uniref:helix-turn-helix domain-containing protein n=1 Tax=Burkholderia thailandensis TaxID=57975 RepID=UPI0021C91C9C